MCGRHASKDEILRGRSLNALISRTSLVFTTLFFAIAANADDTKIQELLSANTHSISLNGNEITGSGADLILRLAENAQFVALGEEHNNLHIPAITTALFAELNEQYDFRYFMTEQDPVMMELITRPPARGSLKATNDLARRYPMGFTFNSDEELKMLTDLVRISGAESDAIWGCDQAAGVTHTLEQLLLEVDGEKERALVQEKRDVAALIEKDRNYETSHFIMDTDASWFTDLKVAIDPKPGSRAEWLLDVLIKGNTVFGFYNRGDQGLIPGYYENNRYREEHLKDLCLDKYRQAEKIEANPKALMKFGSWHLYEGLSPTRIHTIGDFFSNVARFNGTDFLSINFVSLPEDPEASMSEIGYAWPFISQLDPEAFTVVDLRPFRHYRNRVLLQEYAGEEWSTSYKEDFIRLVYGYDLLFFVGRTEAANFEVVPAVDQEGS
jgi:hypothetical protein